MKQFNKTLLCKLIENMYSYSSQMEHSGIYLLCDDGIISNREVCLRKVNSLLKRYGKKEVFE